MIEIESPDDSPQSSRMMVATPQRRPISEPTTSGSTADAGATTPTQISQPGDLQKLTYQNLMQSSGSPCVLDEHSLAGKNNIYCFCDGYNSIYHPTNQTQLQTLVMCR